MKYCSSCRKEFEDGIAFCPECGEKLLVGAEPKEKNVNDSKNENTIKTKNSPNTVITLIIIGIVVLILLVASIVYFISTVRVPNVIGVDEETAKQSILNANLIPAIEKGYADNKVYDGEYDIIGKISRTYVENGKIISMDPKPLKRIGKNNRVTLTVSNGPKYYKITSSEIGWDGRQIKVETYSIDDVIDGTIDVEIEVTSPSGKNIKWDYSGTATAPSSDQTIGVTIDKVTKPSLKLDPSEWYAAITADDYEITDRIAKAGETVALHVKIPVKDFGTLNPEVINMQLQCHVNDNYQNIEFNFKNTYGFDD